MPRRLGLVVERPRRPQHGAARALDLEQHLRAGVRDRLVGADRALELRAVLGVGDRHLHRALAEADRLGRGHDRDRVPGAGEPSRSPESSSPAGPSSRTVHRRRVVSSVSAGSISTSAASTTKCRPPSAVTTIRSARRGVGHRDLHAAQVVAPSDEPLRVAVGVLVPLRDRPAPAVGQPRPPRPRRRAAAPPPTSSPAASARTRSRAPRPPPPARRCRGPTRRTRELRPAELHDLVPLRVGEAALLLQRQPPDLLQLVARAEELARRALDVLLVLGEVEVHSRSAARARARRRCS